MAEGTGQSSHEGGDYRDVWGRRLADVDADIDLIIRLEEERQARRLIFIPSESICPQPVREALASVFTNVYAEGYPPLRMMEEDEAGILDLSRQLANYRRYGDRRFYKGADYVHFIECLAQRRCASLFATPDVSAADIYVNVQPLSGAAANLAVYDAFLKAGDTLMGMDLFQGGHLTHGSEFNISGRRYHVVSYGVDPKTERLDYEAIQRLALEYRPKLIVAGFTSYPWAPDWKAFREIADACGALLMADIAHTAGLVCAGVCPSPVGLADVITFTTHKTMCGPRGAVIMTTDEDRAKLVDAAVFPGAQGGPHTNKFAAMAVAFKIAATPQFRELQQRIVVNAQALAAGLQSRGLRVAYGGTDTHMCLLDLRAIETPNGLPVRGEIAVRIMELCGLVANKNTLPGDTVTALASGVRLGTPWLTQRGMGPTDMDVLAGLIHRIVTNVHPFYYIGSRGEMPRGKIPFEIIEEVKRQVNRIAEATPAETAARGSGYPHYDSAEGSNASATSVAEATPILQATTEGAVGVDLTAAGILQISGDRASAFLQQVATRNLAELRPQQADRTLLLEPDGTLMSDATLWRMSAGDTESDRYWLTLPAETRQRVRAWLRDLSDGYVVFDPDDLLAKVEGPVVVDDLGDEPPAEDRLALIVLQGTAAPAILHGLGVELSPAVWWHGALQAGEALRDQMAWVALAASGDMPRYEILVHQTARRVLLEALHARGATVMGPEAEPVLRTQLGWPLPSATEKLSLAHLQQAYPAYFALTKPYFVGQKAYASLLPASDKREFHWEDKEQPLKRTPLYEEHRRLTRKIIPFAGWEMPVWYTSVAEEHQAVRRAAGLFDVAHMGVLEVAGEHAAAFLDLVSTNYVRWLRDGQSCYSYLMDPDGHVLDDLMIYRRCWDRYLVVVNAANTDKDLAWLRAVNAGEVRIDRANPAMQTPAPVTIRNLQSSESGADRLVDLALQGPKSLAILQSLTEDPRQQRALARIRRTHFIETVLAGIPLIVARTGYTGEDIGYELYVHPDHAVRLWRLLLENGEKEGLRPCGLAARDSTRMEAGLPLYGHELAGPHDIKPTEAGFALFVKFHKPFFIGRQACIAQEANRTMAVVRFRVDRSGARALRQDDPVVNRNGQHIGWVTSCTLIGGMQMGMAYVEKRYNEAGTPIGIFALPAPDRMPEAKPMNALQLGDRVLLPEWATVLERFPTPEEKARRSGAEPQE